MSRKPLDWEVWRTVIGDPILIVPEPSSWHFFLERVRNQTQDFKRANPEFDVLLGGLFANSYNENGRFVRDRSCDEWFELRAPAYDLADLLKVAGALVDASKCPHKCPKCGSPAYVGFSSVECSKGCLQ